MRIEELIIEGFKSYPVRTTISGWDPSFNAITGLNGSGKSNILDAICFVLGMTNMSNMRAQTQQDLIYKRGQAGVTKASVTIVFDNSDRATSPVGLENCKQITVTRQIALPNVSKYILNGHKSQQHIVQTLFQGVQLNINNPHFLIMQGRITKVLNMRPQEILGMVEEAAGTRMFEERKDKARKTMGKKEKRVQEITSLLQEEITPKLDALRTEKRSFLQYQKACSELERLDRLLRAWEWKEASNRVQRKETDIANKEKETTRANAQKQKLGGECTAAERDAKDIARKRDEELKKGGKFKKREEEVAELEKALVKLKTQADIKRNTISDEESDMKEHSEQLKQLQDSLSQKKDEVQKFSDSYEDVKRKQTEMQATLSNAEELLQSLLTGLSGSSGGSAGGGYLGQIAEAKTRLGQAEAEEKEANVRLTMSETDMKALQSRWKSVEKESSAGKQTLKAMEAEVEKLRKKVTAFGWDAEKERQAEESMQATKTLIRELSTKYETARHQLSVIDFNYTPPSPNFDRSKVKGLVASLISLNESDYPKSTALEISAGGRLYNVVVDDERVGKELLDKGHLKKRVTIIPLNKINAFKLSAEKLKAANKVGGNKVRLALSLVGYERDVEAAMAYVFGDTIICDDAESAKAVTFNPSIAVKSVTLDGDVYDPSGTLSGGSAPSSGGTLIKVQQLKALESRLKETKQELAKLESEATSREKWRELSREFEMKEHEMHLLAEQVGGSNAAQVEEEVKKLQRTIDDARKAVHDAKDRQKAAKQEVASLEKDMKEFKTNKDGKIDELKSSISKQKAALQKHIVVVKTQHRDSQAAVLDLEQAESEIKSRRGNLAEAKTTLEKTRKELDSLSDKAQDAEDKHAVAAQKLKEERATLTRFDDELREIEEVIKKKKQEISDVELQVKKIEHEIQSLNKERATSVTHVAQLEKLNPWVEEEKQHFGQPNTPYDFESVDMTRIKEKARDLEEQQKGMKKKINPKVLNMIETVEKKESALTKMLSTVLKDKEKIESTIHELDQHKLQALQKTWEKVNCDFGAIFTELLPGNFAKLEPPEGQDLTQGLEVKVQLGAIWKQSLTELSGGQRSLIALSLIMSLLQFKPAPMYILDEIDAALDLSHTQHIGQLFRTRFKGSQFIVVSLKEGLFTNANVLFRARFRDGTSVVERTAQRSTSALYDSSNKENEDVAPRSTGRKGKS